MLSLVGRRKSRGNILLYTLLNNQITWPFLGTYLEILYPLIPVTYTCPLALDAIDGLSGKDFPNVNGFVYGEAKNSPYYSCDYGNGNSYLFVHLTKNNQKQK